jgi:hypothetical protein
MKVGMLLQAYRADYRVRHCYGAAQLPARRRENQQVFDEADVEEAGPRQPLI